MGKAAFKGISQAHSSQVLPPALPMLLEACLASSWSLPHTYQAGQAGGVYQLILALWQPSKLMGRNGPCMMYTPGLMRRHFPPVLTTSLQFPGPTWWEERTNSHRLSSDPHVHAVHTCALPPTINVQNCNKMLRYAHWLLTLGTAAAANTQHVLVLLSALPSP